MPVSSLIDVHVAVSAPRADAFAAHPGIPCRVRPFNRRFPSHGASSPVRTRDPSFSGSCGTPLHRTYVRSIAGRPFACGSYEPHHGSGGEPRSSLVGGPVDDELRLFLSRSERRLEMTI